MKLVVEILKAFNDAGPLSPGDVAQKLSVPKYKALATVSCLYELGLLESVYSKGSYKIFRLSDLGRELLLRVESGHEAEEVIRNALAGEHGQQVQQSAPLIHGEAQT